MADLTGVKLHYVDRVEKAVEFLSWLSERRPGSAIAIDLETGELDGRPKKDALSPWHGRIRLVQVGDGLTAWAIPWADWRGLFMEAMSKFDGQLIFHNIAFEARWFALHSNWSVPWHRSHDTMIQAHIIDPLGSGALKQLAGRYVDARAAALQTTLDQAMVKNGWTWGTIPVNFGQYWQYGALDCILTCRLWELFHAQTGVEGPYRLVYDMEMATRRVVTQMELNGARVDLEYSRRKYQELHDYAERVRTWARGRYAINCGSNRDLIRIFEDELDMEVEGVTATGQKSMDKDQLAIFAQEHQPTLVQELAQAVLKMRKAGKLAETYFKNIIDDEVDGLIHFSVKTLGARTSRMSISRPGPAMQTLPKSDTVVRTAFIARDPENEVLVSSDLDQVEFRMVASLSEDPGLINLFNKADADAAAGDENADAFTYIMRELYRDPAATKKDKRRRLIKGQVYGRLYGAGVAKQALTAGVPEAQMREVAEAFDHSYPGVKDFTARVEDAGVRRLRSEGQGYVVTATGRRLPCDDTKAYTLVNYLIQASAAEVFKFDLLKLDAAGLGDFLIVPVHDEAVLSLPKEIVNDAIPVIKESMTTRDAWKVPLTAGVAGPSSNWGELSDG